MSTFNHRCMQALLEIQSSEFGIGSGAAEDTIVS